MGSKCTSDHSQFTTFHKLTSMPGGGGVGVNADVLSNEMLIDLTAACHTILFLGGDIVV